MKNKKIICFCIFLILVILSSTNLLVKYHSEKPLGEKLLDIKDKVDNNLSTSSIILKKVDNNNTISITSTEIECYRLLNPSSENIKEDIIESKIFSQEAKERNIDLTEDELNNINSIINSNDLFKDQKLTTEKEKIKDILYEYLLDIKYTSILKEQIMSEISNYNLSIQDDEINKKLNEYKILEEKARNTEDINKEELFREIYLKYSEIQKLYYSKIMNKYIISS